jgi:uncharacterized BrkB/YihY/UPF0761 family membrane protein
MLPDEALRQETRQFTAFNRSLLVVLLLLSAAFLALAQIRKVPAGFEKIYNIADQLGPWLLLFLTLLPLAMTMALIWKTKEVVLDGVFGAK